MKRIYNSETKDYDVVPSEGYAPNRVLTVDADGNPRWSDELSRLSKENENRDLPRIFFNGEFPGAKADGERPVTMTYISRARRFTAYATAKVQGSSSTTFKKKNYTFKLYKDAERTTKMKVAFRNWPEENKFVAKANTIDRTHSRNVVSCRIWADMVCSREGYANLPAELRESPNMGAVDGFPVQIYLNGVYQGLYTWNIPKDDWMMGMDSDLIDQHAVICGEGSTNATTGQNGVRHNTFNEAYPDISQVISNYDWADEIETVGPNIRANFKQFSDLVVNGTDDEFRANISTYVDMESLIDVFIFKWLACDVDGLSKNQYLYTYNAGLPWYCGIYDVDATWGGVPEGTKFVPYDTVMQDGYWTPSSTGLKNRLFERLWALYTKEVRSRWNAVKHGSLSLANIINHFEAFRDAIPAELFAEDSAATTADGYFMTTDDSTHKGFDGLLGVDQNNIQQIRNFAAKRWAYVDHQINLIKCTGISLSASALALTADELTKTLTATLLPADCNEPVVWSTDNEAVAVVSGGTVTAIFNGTCNITTTCGDFSATCAVSVSGLETAGSDNLADPTSPDWMKGYNIGSGGEIAVWEAKPWLTVTNYIPMKYGDVFTVEGCQARYGGTGYANYNIYDAEKELITTTSMYTAQENGYVTVDNRVTTWNTESLNWMSDGAKNRIGYVRFQLTKFDSQTDIDTDNIVIKRNPNGENADAWA